MRERQRRPSCAGIAAPTRGMLQVGRAVVFAVACAGLGLGGHLAGGGGLPPGLILVSVFLGLLAAGAFLARRRLGKATGMVCAGAAQLVQHTIFAASAGLGSMSAGSMSVGSMPHGHEPWLATPAGAAPPGTLDGSAHPEAMTVAHVVAGAGLGIVLAQLDAIVWKLLEPFWRPLALMSPAPLPIASRGDRSWWIELPASRPASARPPCRGPPHPGPARCPASI